MSTTALVLVLSGACLHAIWALASKAGSVFRDPLGFTWASGVVSICVLAIPAGATISSSHLDWGRTMLGAGIAAAVQLVYFLTVQASYAVGDVSILYPMARGLGPALSIVGAMLLFGERPGALAVIGAALIVAGVVVIGVIGSSGGRPSTAVVLYGAATGALIATYTLWDAFAVRALETNPIVHIWLIVLLQTLALTPVILGRRRSVAPIIRNGLPALLLAGTTTAASYVAILFALRLAPATLVAPLRETSVVIVSIAGWLIFKEPRPLPRVVGALIVVAGATCIALG